MTSGHKRHTDIGRLIVLISAFWIAGTGSTRAQKDSSRPTVVAPMVQDTPRIDGRLDDAVWASAAKVTGFIQTEPLNGVGASQKTEVQIAYTSRALLIGARLMDEEPSRIVATEYRRDGNLEADDSFEIYLDTFHDRRNAFYFATNPAGAQRDALRARARITTDSWTPIHPVWLRCSSVIYPDIIHFSRLARRAPRRPRMGIYSCPDPYQQ